MPAPGLRRMLHSPAVVRVRESLAEAVPPFARVPYVIAHHRDPTALVRAVRMTVPGGAHQRRDEIAAFVDLARSREPRTVCEIGVADGGTTMVLAHCAPSVRTMIAIDLEMVRSRTPAALVPPRVAFHPIEASSFDPRTVAQVRSLLSGASIDLLFIDGSHDYEDVRADFLAYRNLVSPGGLIAFHDIVSDHQARFGRPTPAWTGGVPQLWQELSCHSKRTHEFVDDPDQDGCGIGVLEHDPDSPLPTEWSDGHPQAGYDTCYNRSRRRPSG